MRQLVTDAFQRRLPDQFGDQRLGRLVGDLAVRVVRGPLVQQRDQHVGQHVHLLAADRRTGHDVFPTHPELLLQRIDFDQMLGQSLRTDQVGLGGDCHQPGRTGQRGDLAHQVLVPRPDVLVGREKHRDHVHLAPRGVDEVVEPLLQQ